jgi:hypothetical protein
MNVQNSSANLHFEDGKNHDFKRKKTSFFNISYLCQWETEKYSLY